MKNLGDKKCINMSFCKNSHTSENNQGTCREKADVYTQTNMSEEAPLLISENEYNIEENIRSETYKENREATSDENTSKLKVPPRKVNKHMTLRKQKRKTRRQGEKPVWKVENLVEKSYLHKNVPNLEEEIEIEMTERQMTEASEKASDIVYDDQKTEGNECIASDRLLQPTNEARIFPGNYSFRKKTDPRR
ncbi:hypothetical protein JTB14_012137 [Gonioctena quinquepunctata]|nr:hypothetical protein JTB14_012137 [Gonioctena quinquepunctata]